MGIYSARCRSCNELFAWFSGDSNQTCTDCKLTINSAHEFLDKNVNLMGNLVKHEEVDKLKVKLQELKTAHGTMGSLIRELEEHVKEKS